MPELGEASLRGQGLTPGLWPASHSTQRSRAQEETLEHGTSRGPGTTGDAPQGCHAHPDPRPEDCHHPRPWAAWLADSLLALHRQRQVRRVPHR